MEYKLIAPRDNRLNDLEQVLSNRGIKLENIHHFLYPQESDILDPLLLDNMKDGAKMLIQHIQNNDKIFIQVDSDCDGFTSSAILINYLNCLFPHFVQTKICYRVHTGKQHGLFLETIPKDVKLVIAPDSSSNDYEVHRSLAEQGIDVLVLDHHEAEKVSEYACVINNQMCDYPTKFLSGAGIVYKFCSYLDSLLKTNYADDYLDLTIVGIIADVMELKSYEIRALLLKGTQYFKNPLLKALQQKDGQHFKEDTILTPFNISWYISPAINAINRVGTIEEKKLVFESMLEFLAYKTIPSTKRGCKGQFETRVEQAARTCTNVKNRQKRMKDNAIPIITKIINDEHLDDNQIIAVRLDPSYQIDSALTGLIANDLLSTYNKSVLILNRIDYIEEIKNEQTKEIELKKRTKWEGSGRGYSKADLGSFRDLLESSGLVNFAQGHAQAFGTSIPDQNFKDLINYVNKTYEDFDFTPIHKVDLIWDGNKEITPQMILKIADQEKIWGKGVEDPLIAIEGLRLYGDHVRLYGVDKGKPTLSISLNDGGSLVKFKSSEEEFRLLHSDLGYVIINVVGNCTKNSWGPQFIIRDYEIVGRNDYYF